MCFYIGIEDLAANALIESMKNEDCTFLTYDKIEEYGSKVIQLLNNNGEKAVLILSRDNTDAMFRNYSKYFEEDSVHEEKGIRLKAGIKREELIRKFRGYLALDVLMAFINETSIQALGA